MLLTDSKAARLALLLQLYFEDAGEDGEKPEDLTVAALLHDLEISSSEPEAIDIIATARKIILDLYA